MLTTSTRYAALMRKFFPDSVELYPREFEPGQMFIACKGRVVEERLFPVFNSDFDDQVRIVMHTHVAGIGRSEAWTPANPIILLQLADGTVTEIYDNFKYEVLNSTHTAGDNA